MSEQVDYRQQWADGEIEAGTLLDEIESLQYANIQLAQKFGVAHAEADALRAENAKLRTALAEQGGRQEAVATVGAVIDRKRKVFSIDVLDATALPPGTMLYTTPQPGPDVRRLVEAVQLNLATISDRLADNEAVCTSRLSMAKALDRFLKAQQVDSNDT